MNKRKGSPRPTSAAHRAKATQAPSAGKTESGSHTKIKVKPASSTGKVSHTGSSNHASVPPLPPAPPVPRDAIRATGECVAKTTPWNATANLTTVTGDAAAVTTLSVGDKVSTTMPKKTRCIYQRAFDMHVRNPLSDKCQVYTRYYLVQRIPPARHGKNPFAGCPPVEYDSTFFQSLKPKRTFYVIHPDFSSERCAVSQMKRAEQQMARLTNGGRVPFQQCHLDADTVAIPVLPPCACPHHLPHLPDQHASGISCQCEPVSNGKHGHHQQQLMQGATAAGDQASEDCCGGRRALMMPAEMVLPMQRKWVGGPMMVEEYTRASVLPSTCEMLNRRHPLLPPLLTKDVTANNKMMMTSSRHLAASASSTNNATSDAANTLLPLSYNCQPNKCVKCAHTLA